jgi:hypothetical protein
MSIGCASSRLRRQAGLVASSKTNREIQAMLKVVASVIAGLVVGLAIAAFWPPDGADRSDAGSLDGQDARRLTDLERALHDERERRAALEQRLDAVDATLAALADRPATLAEPAPDGERAGVERATVAAAEAVADSPAPQPERGSRFPTPDQRLDRLVSGGITPQRAQWLLERTEELRMQALQAMYDARREGRPVDQATFADEQSLLRKEIGDAEYEQYLSALGRPTAVAVGDVLARSPAETAGLRSGDRIVSYAGTRVFDLRDLNRLTFEGEPAQPVIVEVLRDGQRIQLVMPRGPIGITAGRFGRP